MTGQAKQTERRCEVIPGAGQTRTKIWDEKKRRQSKSQFQRGGKRVRDGREERWVGRRGRDGEDKRKAPPRRCASY